MPRLVPLVSTLYLWAYHGISKQAEAYLEKEGNTTGDIAADTAGGTEGDTLHGAHSEAAW